MHSDIAAPKLSFAWTTILAFCALPFYSPAIARADTGVVVYGSKGTDQRRTDSGHISLLVTDLCACGIDQVRECQAGERPGVIITAYSNLAADYTKSVFVVPLLDHLAAVDDSARIPVLSSGPSLRTAQIAYWRQHLRPYFPPIKQERYTEMRAELDRFDAGRTLRRFFTMEFIGTMLGSHKHQDATEPIALIDPETQELIPDGRWREAIGTEQMRSAVALIAPSSVTQELRLVRYLQGASSQTFNVMSGNCSDFVEGALLAVYGDAGLRFRSRTWDLADAWITSPLFVATGFVSYAKKNEIPLRVAFLPITAGTRRSRFSVHSLSRGALVPDPTQGKMAFSLKVYVNFLNPLLGATGLTVDQLSRLVSLPHLIHDWNSGDLLNITTSTPADLRSKVNERERVRMFGTSSCWKAKQQAFQKLASQAVETGLLNRAEGNVVLKQGRPFLLPRIYEHPADQSTESFLMPVAAHCLLPDCSRQVSPVNKIPSPEPALDGGVIPGRRQIRMMAESGEQAPREMAFKLIASVINFDLSSEPTDRRTVQAFDKDWQLLVEVAEKNQLTVPGEAASREALEACSCRSFDTGAEHKDALQQALGFPQRVMRGGRELVTGPAR